MTHTTAIDAGAPHVLDDRACAHPGADVDERGLRASVDEVDVAVERIAQVEAERARADLGEAEVIEVLDFAASFQNLLVNAAQGHDFVRFDAQFIRKPG